GLSEDLWTERKNGTLRRAAGLPQSLGIFLVGKLLAAGLVIFGCSLAVLAAGMLYYGMPLALLPLAAIWATLAGSAMMVLLTFLQLYATSQRAGSILTNSIIMPLLFLGGSFFPFE